MAWVTFLAWHRYSRRRAIERRNQQARGDWQQRVDAQKQGR